MYFVLVREESKWKNLCTATIRLASSSYRLYKVYGYIHLSPYMKRKKKDVIVSTTFRYELILTFILKVN